MLTEKDLEDLVTDKRHLLFNWKCRPSPSQLSAHQLLVNLSSVLRFNKRVNPHLFVEGGARNWIAEMYHATSFDGSWSSNTNSYPAVWPQMSIQPTLILFSFLSFQIPVKRLALLNAK